MTTQNCVPAWLAPKLPPASRRLALPPSAATFGTVRDVTLTLLSIQSAGPVVLPLRRVRHTMASYARLTCEDALLDVALHEPDMMRKLAAAAALPPPAPLHESAVPQSPPLLVRLSPQFPQPTPGCRWRSLA